MYHYVYILQSELVGGLCREQPGQRVFSTALMPNSTAECPRRVSPATQLLRYARSLKLRPGHLDEVIHHLAHELGRCAEAKIFADPRLRGDGMRAAERRAACINNGGLSSQVAFLLCHEGTQGSRVLLRQIAARRPNHSRRPRHRHRR